MLETFKWINRYYTKHSIQGICSHCLQFTTLYMICEKINNLINKNINKCMLHLNLPRKLKIQNWQGRQWQFYTLLAIFINLLIYVYVCRLLHSRVLYCKGCINVFIEKLIHSDCSDSFKATHLNGTFCDIGYFYHQYCTKLGEMQIWYDKKNV